MRLRVRNAKVKTLDQRIECKRSLDSGEEEVYDPIEKRMKSLHELLAEKTILTLEHAFELGHGIYGQAKLLRDENGNDAVVAKIVGCAPFLAGHVKNSRFRSERIEPVICNFLWKNVAEQRISPHLIAPIGPYQIVSGSTAKQREECADLESSSVFFTERATANDLKSYLDGLTKLEFNAQIKVLLFHVLYTLGAIQIRWPQFKHNDLSSKNVFLNVCESTGHTKYTIYGRDYWVPRIGVMALMADFDFSCIPGILMDNYKVLEFEWEVPTYSINAKKNLSSDMFYFITYIRDTTKEKLSTEMQQLFRDIFGQIETANLYRLRPDKTEASVSVRDLFTETSFFDDFCAETSNIDAFNADAPNRNLMEYLPVKTIDLAHDYRYCPHFTARTAGWNDGMHLPSMQYWLACQARVPKYDQEKPADYDERIATRLVSALNLVYDAPKMEFNQDKRELCMETVHELGKAFLKAYNVQRRWWPAIYTCAFIDTIEQLGLCRDNQRCWLMDEWSVWWKEQKEMEYADIQLIHVSMQWNWLQN